MHDRAAECSHCAGVLTHEVAGSGQSRAPASGAPTPTTVPVPVPVQRGAVRSVPPGGYGSGHACAAQLVLGRSGRGHLGGPAALPGEGFGQGVEPAGWGEGLVVGAVQPALLVVKLVVLGVAEQDDVARPSAMMSCGLSMAK